MAMPRLTVLCLVGWLAAGAAGVEPPAPKPPPLTKEQQDKLKERDRLLQETNRLLGDKHGDEAMAVAEKALALTREVRGEQDPETLNLSRSLAEAYEQQANFPAAQKLRRQVVDTLTRLHGKDHWQVTDARLAQEGVEHLARLAPADRRRLAEAEQLNEQAFRLYQQGKTHEALPSAQKALEIRKQVLGERHPDYALSLNNLVALYRAEGEYAKAEPLYRQALELRKQVLGPRHPYYATSLNNLGVLYQSQGEWARAEPLYRQALEIRKQVLGERHPDFALSLYNLAGLYQSQGEYAPAEVLLRQALEIRNQVLGQRHPDYAAGLNLLAGLYQSQGEYAQAEPLYRQALAIQKEALGERHPLYAIGLNNLGLLYLTQQAYGKALAIHRQALAIQKEVLGERHPDYATSLTNLAAVYRSQAEYAQAEPLLQQALAIQKQVLGERHPDYAASLHTLADLYQAQGEYARAEPLLRQALEIRKQVLGPRHPNYALSLNNLARLYREQGEFAQAEPLYRQAITALRQRPEGPPLEWGHLTAADLRPLPETITCLANYCALLEQRLGARPTPEQLRAADYAFALALAVRERLRQEVLEQDASKVHHGADTVDLIPRRIGLCQRLFAEEGRLADLETALATAEQGSARVFLEQLGKGRALTVGRVRPELRAEEAALRRQLRELDSRLALEQDKSAGKRDSDKVGRLLDDQKQVTAQLTALIRRLEKEFPQYAALQYPKPCSLAQVRACLTPTEVALHFIPGSQKSYLVLVEARPAPGDPANGLAVYALPSGAEIADGVSCLTDRDTVTLPLKARANAAEAYDLILAPVKERIRGKDLVIVPGGALAYVPFEVLVEDGRYLIEQHRIRYAPSLTALYLLRLWEKTRPQPQRPLWAMADPVYDPADQRSAGKLDLAQATRATLTEYLSRTDRGSAVGKAYARLRFTGAEAEAIRVRLGAADADVLTGVQATEAAVKAASAQGLLARARYVHFATHGILGLDTGQPPALVLSLVGNDGKHDEDGGINDGFLRLDEVTRLQLNADLVVLSACETGKGRLYAGEGVTGLARAFLYAGSRGVVASLWAVDDRETAAFMAQLYGGLKDGQAAADALRAAKLEMIRDRKPPVYWAPFILIGE
jgi:CHAT domain-containing protein/Tfp pilus assembly protein PilF